VTAQPLLVIKVGGALLRSGATLEGTAASIAATQRAGYRVVVVHGGGSAISTLAYIAAQGRIYHMCPRGST